MPDRPFALHITWTCYGNWLPGDARGHVSNTLFPKGGHLTKQNTPGTPYSEGASYTHEHARSLQAYPTVLLNREQALYVANSLVKVAQSREWYILQAAIMANHIHVVIAHCPNDGPAVRRVLKGNTQAALSEQCGHSCRWFTAGGSDRYKNDQRAIDAAVQYVADQEGMLAGIKDMQVFIPQPTTNERRGLSPP
jgi:REP element-mobilizing transposase RayT